MFLHLGLMLLLIGDDDLMRDVLHWPLPSKLLFTLIWFYLAAVGFASIVRLWWVHHLSEKDATPPRVLESVRQRFDVHANRDIVMIRMIWIGYLAMVVLIGPFPIPFTTLAWFNYGDYWRAVHGKGRLNAFLLLRSDN